MSDPCLIDAGVSASFGKSNTLTQSMQPAQLPEAHLSVQEEGLGAPVARPLVVQVQQHAHQQRLPGLAVHIIPKSRCPPAQEPFLHHAAALAPIAQ